MTVGPGESLLVYDERTERYAGATPEALTALGLVLDARAPEIRA